MALARARSSGFSLSWANSSFQSLMTLFSASSNMSKSSWATWPGVVRMWKATRTN